MRAELVRPAHAAIVVIAACVLGVAGCSSVDGQGTSCVEREQELIRQIESTGRRLLNGLSYETTEYSGCEDKGVVDPFVNFVVRVWSVRREAITTLREQGWEPEQVTGRFAPRATFRSPDSRWVAVVYVGGEERKVTIHLRSRAQFLRDVQPTAKP